MGPAERFNLSLTSKRMEVDVQMARSHIHSAVVIFYHKYSKVLLRGEQKSFRVICTRKGYEIKTGNQIKTIFSGEALRSWFWKIVNRIAKGEKSDLKYGSIIESAGEALKQLQKSSNCKKLSLQIQTKNLNKGFIAELLSNKNLENSTNISMINVNFDDAAIMFFLDTAKVDRSFQFSKSQIPLDFRHQNAFKFKYSKYDDARWVTLDELMKIKNTLGWVRLSETNLTSNDLRNYITHWINSEQDLFRRMYIKTQEDILLDGLFDGLVVLELLRAPSSTITTLAKSTSRELPVLCVVYASMFIILTSFRLDEPLGNLWTAERFNVKYEILQLLENKDKLEKEMEQEADFRIRRRLTDEVVELTERLTRLGVFFESGRAIISFN